MRISIIIPVYNEAGNIKRLLNHLASYAQNAEVIVVDGGSKDQTLQEVRLFERVELLLCSNASRAEQMNLGARQAKGDILYFLHADALPPIDFENQIIKAVEKGHFAGCFRFIFDSSKPLLRINSFFTRLPFLWCRGGDQSLYIQKDLFWEMGGYDETYAIMEEYVLIKKLMAERGFHILPDAVKVSARKYSTNSWFKVMRANFIAFRQFKKGECTETIKQTYRKNLNPY